MVKQLIHCILNLISDSSLYTSRIATANLLFHYQLSLNSDEIQMRINVYLRADDNYDELRKRFTSCSNKRNILLGSSWVYPSTQSPRLNVSQPKLYRQDLRLDLSVPTRTVGSSNWSLAAVNVRIEES